MADVPIWKYFAGWYALIGGLLAVKFVKALNRTPAERRRRFEKSERDMQKLEDMCNIAPVIFWPLLFLVLTVIWPVLIIPDSLLPKGEEDDA